MLKDFIRHPDIFKELPEVLTLTEVAKLLQIHKSSLYRYVKRVRKPLPVVYLGKRTPRVLKSQLFAWLEKISKK